MENEMTNKGTKQQKADWFKYVFVIFSKWYFILAGLLIGFFVGYMINRYSVNVYKVTSQLIVKKGDDSNSMMLGVGGSLRIKQSTDSRREIASLRSDKVIGNTLRNLDFSISYYEIGNVRMTEVFPDKPFFVYYDTLSLLVPYNVLFQVSIYDGSFKVSSENKIWQNKLPDSFVPLGEYIGVGGFKFSIRANPSYTLNKENKIVFAFNSYNNLLANYKSSIAVRWIDPASTLVDISLTSTCPSKDKLFLETYYQSVISNNLRDKYESSANAIKFLDDQVEHLKDTLFYIDTKIDRLRLRNKRALKGTDAIFSELDSLEVLDAKLEFENRYYDFIKEYVDSTKPQDVFAPNMIGMNNELLTGFMKEYIQIKFDSRLYKSDKNISNPLIQLQDRKARRLEENIYENISNLKFKNDSERNKITRNISKLHESIPDLQLVSNEVKELLRFSRLYENLLTIMQQKRLESNLLIAGTTTDYEVIERPKFSTMPISPNRSSNLVTWIFICVLIPIVIIVVMALVDPNITSKADIIEILDFPIIGTVWHNSSVQKIVILDNPRSMISESFRGICAKLKYFLNPESESHVILITSSLSGEGKSFNSVNLASMYALSGQRTILIGADLRKPSLHQYFYETKTEGLSNYLAGQIDSKTIVKETSIDNLYFIGAGDIPPNPFELLSSHKMKELIDLLKLRFDKIIIDTPPLLLVSDSLPLTELSDVNLLLIRNNKTLKPSLLAVQELYESHQINKFTIIYNDLIPAKTAYGYDYGYGYGYGYDNKYYN